MLWLNLVLRVFWNMLSVEEWEIYDLFLQQIVTCQTLCKLIKQRVRLLETCEMPMPVFMLTCEACDVVTCDLLAWGVAHICRISTPPIKSWILYWQFQDLISPEKSLWSWRVLEKYPWKSCIFSSCSNSNSVSPSLCWLLQIHFMLNILKCTTQWIF